MHEDDSAGVGPVVLMCSEGGGRRAQKPDHGDCRDDPAPYRTIYDNAQATLASTKAKAERYARLRTENAIAPQDADQSLEDIAFRLVDEWIWYDEEDAALERARYANYGYPVRGANLKSEKLALLRQRSTPHSTLTPENDAVRAALASQWLKAA